MKYCHDEHDRTRIALLSSVDTCVYFWGEGA